MGNYPDICPLGDMKNKINHRELNATNLKTMNNNFFCFSFLDDNSLSGMSIEPFSIVPGSGMHGRLLLVCSLKSGRQGDDLHLRQMIYAAMTILRCFNIMAFRHDTKFYCAFVYLVKHFKRGNFFSFSACSKNKQTCCLWIKSPRVTNLSFYTSNLKRISDFCYHIKRCPVKRLVNQKKITLIMNDTVGYASHLCSTPLFLTSFNNCSILLARS